MEQSDFPQKENNYFAYTLIMEFGDENFYQQMTRKFVKNAKNGYKLKEKELIKDLKEPAKVLIQIHKGFVKNII